MARFAHQLDRFAVLLSGLCLLHCLAGGLLLAGAAVAGGFLAHEVHAVGLLLAVPLAVVALWRGVRVHGRWQVMLLGAVGVLMMGGSLLVGHGAALELWLSVAGVSVLAVAHIWNMRAARG